MKTILKWSSTRDLSNVRGVRVDNGGEKTLHNGSKGTAAADLTI